MTMEELLVMFEEYEELVYIREVHGEIWISVLDFEGFDENWNEIIIDIPMEVCERIAACELAGIHVDYASMDI